MDILMGLMARQAKRDAIGSLIDYGWIVAINYRYQLVFIKWLGTHADYDKIDVKTVRYGHQAN